jgi:carbon monoxide dehydrogenase subunit G
MAIELTHQFPITKPVDEAFAVIVDLERLVPCVDGGSVLERTGPDSVVAEIEVAMGMMSMTFKGTVDTVEQDAGSHRALFAVRSSEVTGEGDADADVEFLLADGLGTIKTSARMTGTPMSMGEAVAAGVLDALITDFAGTLAEQV